MVIRNSSNFSYFGPTVPFSKSSLASGRSWAVMKLLYFFLNLLRQAPFVGAPVRRTENKGTKRNITKKKCFHRRMSLVVVFSSWFSYKEFESMEQFGDLDRYTWKYQYSLIDTCWPPDLRNSPFTFALSASIYSLTPYSTSSKWADFDLSFFLYIFILCLKGSLLHEIFTMD